MMQLRVIRSSPASLSTMRSHASMATSHSSLLTAVCIRIRRTFALGASESFGGDQSAAGGTEGMAERGSAPAGCGAPASDVSVACDSAQSGRILCLATGPKRKAARRIGTRNMSTRCVRR